MALAPKAKTVLLVASAAAVALLAVAAQRFHHFVTEDPRLCLSCHRASPEFALWAEGSHRGVACQRCHHSTPEQGVAMMKAFAAGGRPDGKHADVVLGSCATCHFSHDPRWRDLVASPGHRVHWEEKRIACVKCHAASMHGFAPVASSCATCHPGHAVGVHGMEALHCFACHGFLGEHEALRPGRRDCLRCHAARGVEARMDPDAAPMKMDCSSCHRPHRPPGDSLAACTECHEPAGVARAGLHGARGHARCTACHVPHVWTSAAEACVRCHSGAPAHAHGRACLECHSFAGAPAPAAPPRPAAREAR